LHLVCQETALLSLSKGSAGAGALQSSVQEAAAPIASVLHSQDPGVEKWSDLVIVTADTYEAQGALETQSYRLSKFHFLSINIQTYPSGACHCV